MRVRVHELVYRRLCDVAAAQKRTKRSIIQDALVRLLGLEGIPLPEEAIYGDGDGAAPDVGEAEAR